MRLLSKMNVTAACLVAGLMSADLAQAEENTFRWAFQGDAQSLDPHSLNESFTLGFLSNIYEALVRRDSNLRLEPALAERWEQIEPTRWRFHLRRGVAFHNGNPFNADDVIFTFERARKEGSNAKSYIPAGLTIERMDDYTLDFVTPEPNPILFHEWPNLLIMDREWSEANNAAVPSNVAEGSMSYAAHHTNGTGAFRLESRTEGVKTVLVPNEDWWDEPRHNLDRAIFLPIATDATRVAALLSGEVDLAYPVPIQDIQAVEAAEGTNVVSGPEARTIFLGMDQFRDELLYSDVKGRNPFKDKRVREAFYRAINVELINEKVLRGLGTPSALMVSPLIYPEGKDAKRLAFDPARAEELLSEAGYPQGFQVQLLCPNNRYVKDEEICLAVAAMLSRVGIRAKVEALPKSQFFKRILARDASFYLLGWTPGSLDSHNVIRNLLGTPAKELNRGNFNFGGFSNARIDELSDDIVQETDQTRRNAMIGEVFDILHDEVGYIPLHQQGLAWGVRDGVKVESRADNRLMLFDVRMD